MLKKVDFEPNKPVIRHQDTYSGEVLDTAFYHKYYIYHY